MSLIKLGPLGEAIVTLYLERKGFAVLERNYRKPWGEIDIIAKNKAGIHFVEVKCIRKAEHAEGQYHPEENAHMIKMRKVANTAFGYLLERRISPHNPWQLDVAAVILDEVRKEAKIRYIEHVSIE